MPSSLGNTNNSTQIYTVSEINSLVSSSRTAIGTASGTNSYTLTLSPALTSYAFGQVFDVQFTNANTGASTLNINGLGAVSIVRNGSKVLKSGDILAGQVFSLFYDGTNFQIIGRVSTGWRPSPLSLGDGVSNGASLSPNSGAGYFANFEAGLDDEYMFNLALDKGGLEYDGSDVYIDLYWMKFGATGGTVIWEIDYAFVSVGENAFTKIDATLSVTVDVTGITNQTLVRTRVPSSGFINGATNAKTLQLTLRRNSSGVGSDSYTGDAEIYGINVEK